MSRSEAHAPRIVFAGGFLGEGDYPDHRHERAWELVYLREGSVTKKSGNERHVVYLPKRSELPIEAVAKGSGYCSASHLGRKLRDAYGMTARQVRATSKPS